MEVVNRHSLLWNYLGEELANPNFNAAWGEECEGSDHCASCLNTGNASACGNGKIDAERGIFFPEKSQISCDGKIKTTAIKIITIKEIRDKALK